MNTSGTDKEKKNKDEEPGERGRQAYAEEPTFDRDEGLDEQDKTLADSFPASDPPAAP
jgi:hypothetical protein